MGRTPRKPETDTQAMLMRRIEQELDRQQLSEAGLARRAGMNQKTLNDIINGAVPKLTAVHKIALGLGVHVADLFRSPQNIAQDATTNVRKLPERYPSWTAKLEKNRTGSKTRRRNTA